MQCQECQSNEFEYNEIMGETACVTCGLILITELFEQTVRSIDAHGETHTKETVDLGSVIKHSGKLRTTQVRYSTNDGHIRKGIVFANMVLSSVTEAKNLRVRIDEVYRELYSKHIFSTHHPLEVRATAVVFFVMRENRTPVSIKEVSAEFNCQGKKLNRLIRKINSHYSHRMSQFQEDPQYMLKKTAYKITEDVVFISQCMETLELFEPIVISSDYNKTPAYYESICWISKNIFVYPRITLKLIAEKNDASWSAIQKQTKELLGLIGLTTCAQVKGKQISELRRE
tara:strand:- start:22445 stop:23302 length:858 start_codon:yes stop_codon:yes gene_type:complete